MKKFCMLFILLFVNGAFAKTIKLYESRDIYSEISTNYEINEDLGRAWVNLSVDLFSDDPDMSPDEYRVKVEGMFYDGSTKSIVVNNDGANVVCANIVTRGRGWFRSERIEKTTECQFVDRTEIRHYDDGFYITKRKYRIIELVIK